MLPFWDVEDQEQPEEQEEDVVDEDEMGSNEQVMKRWRLLEMVEEKRSMEVLL